MNDGLYKIIRGWDMTLGPEKVLVCSAYNNRESLVFQNIAWRDVEGTSFSNYSHYKWMPYSTFHAPRCVPLSPGSSIYPPVQWPPGNGLENYLGRGSEIIACSLYWDSTVHRGTGLGDIDPFAIFTGYYGCYVPQSYDALCLFGFSTPSGYSEPISKISVMALVKGNAKTTFRNIAGTVLYGSAENSPDIYRWIVTDYEQAWNWSDINSLKAGMWLECNSGRCRNVKLRITYGDNQTVDIFPTSLYSDSYGKRVFGNPFHDSVDGAVALYHEVCFRGIIIYNGLKLSYQDVLDVKYSSDFSEFPSRFSQINKIKVYFSYAGIDGYRMDAIQWYEDYLAGRWSYDWNMWSPYESGCTITPYIKIDGTYYYGTARSIGSNLSTVLNYSHEWATNPATGLSWSYKEAQGAQFGLKITRDDANGTVFLYTLYAEIYYNEIAGETVSYKLLNPIDNSIILTQYTQAPIRPDDLTFSLPLGGFIPERTELALVKHGRIVWMGLVWVADQNKNGSGVDVIAKSQQVLLDYRVLPGIQYFPRNKGYDGEVYDIDDMFSDAMPTYPCWQNIFGKEDAEPNPFWAFSGYINNENFNVGLFFFINSWRINTADAPEDGRAIFSADIIPKGLNVAYYDASKSSKHPDFLMWNPPPVKITTDAQNIGGLFRAAWRSNPANVGRGEFSISGDALYTQQQEGSTCILVDHEMDTHIRPGTNDLGDRLLNVLYDWRGIVSVLFSDFFKKMGQEVRYRYELDGNVYQDAAIEIANGSASNPLRKFVHGQNNCKIVKRIPSEPPYNAAIGLGNNPKVASAWAKTRTWISKVFSNTYTADDLQDYLDERLDADDTIYDITITGEEIWLMRPGDYISAQAENDGPVSVRIRQITTRHQQTIIRAGARLSSINEQFGIWRDTKAAEREDNKIRSQEIAAVTGLTQSQAFTIYAEDVKRDRWACKAKVGWDVEVTSPIYYVNGYGILSEIQFMRWPSFVGDPIRTEAVLTISGIYTGFGITKIELKGSKEWNHAVGDYSIQYLVRFDEGAWEGPYTANATPTDSYIGHGLTITAYTMDDGNTVSRIAVYDHIHGAIHVCQTFDVSSFDKFLKLTLNGKVIPPGRYLALGNSGSLEVDITEFCNTSPTSDTSNTLAVQLVGALAIGTNFNYYHHLAKGSIDQFKRFLPLEEVL